MTIEEVKRQYNVSTDYTHLKELMMQGKQVVCFVTYDWNHNIENPMYITDVALARFNECKENKKYSTLMVGCRGTGFIDTYPFDPFWEDRRPFEQECENYQLMYIEPTV